MAMQIPYRVQLLPSALAEVYNVRSGSRTYCTSSYREQQSAMERNASRRRGGNKMIVAFVLSVLSHIPGASARVPMRASAFHSPSPPLLPTTTAFVLGVTPHEHRCRNSAAFGLLDESLIHRHRISVVRIQGAEGGSIPERPRRSDRGPAKPTKKPGRRRKKLAVDCRTVEEVLELAKEHSNDGSRAFGPRDAAACLNRIAQLSLRDGGQRRSLRDRQGEFGAFLGSSLRSLDRYDSKSLAITIQSLAKISNVLGWDDDRLSVLWDPIERRMLGITGECDAQSLANSAWGFAKAGRSSGPLFDSIAAAGIKDLHHYNPQLLANIAWAFATAGRSSPSFFDAIAESAIPLLHQFTPQQMSNLAWAFATAEHSSPVLFDAIAKAAVPLLPQFKPQEFSNTAWAYATAEHSSPVLFDEIAEAAVPLLHKFSPQALSNTAWAFATADRSSSLLFDEIANAAVPLLHRFNPQNLSNMAWAFASADRSSSLLFDKIARAAIPLLYQFSPQALSNAAWAFATAERSSPLLFDKIAETAVPLLPRFNPQGLSNTAWAFATAERPSPLLFDAIAEAAIPLLHQFGPQQLSNLVLGFATVGHENPALFRAAVPAINSRLDEFETQGLANTAWSYAIFDLCTESLFVSPSHFVEVCSSRASEFQTEDLCQLHQWRLWMVEREIDANFSSPLKERCFDAFIESETNTSRFQEDVVSALENIGLCVEEEARTKIGYSIDAKLETGGRTIAVEVDGPSHFIGDSESPKGSTILKYRQIRALEDIELVSVPYWEWHEIGIERNLNKRSLAQSQYLLKLLGIESN